MSMRRFPGTLTRSPVGCHPYILTPEQKEWLCHYFPIIENTRLMKASGMSHATLHRFARDLHLTKSEKGIKRERDKGDKTPPGGSYSPRMRRKRLL